MKNDCTHTRYVTLGPEDPSPNDRVVSTEGWMVCGNHHDISDGCFAQAPLPLTWQITTTMIHVQ